ncbi:hypothetical protein Y1Q_0002577 [Alligator mississippiensis]|uniref:SERTA domain-containing protein n=1 Tax=Alligator mississippiensis TaxID=8496 RepID=A0A151N3I8_ALLMI|nr:hypothetical protein Y1Q_0002577 [Alligator mississippiensis]
MREHRGCRRRVQGAGLGGLQAGDWSAVRGSEKCSQSLCREEILPASLKLSQEDTLQIDSASQAAPDRVVTNTLTTSKVAYFKRKYAEEEHLHQDYHEYYPKHLILPEDRTCILKLSLQKLRFLEDPETYLRRSVLINNLLRKIHLETERESYEYFKEAPCCRTAYSDARKRLKFMDVASLTACMRLPGAPANWRSDAPQ